jgi:hypothetical protein
MKSEIHKAKVTATKILRNRCGVLTVCGIKHTEGVHEGFGVRNRKSDIEKDVPTVAAVYDRRVYTFSETEPASRVTLKPAVIDRRYSGNGTSHS